MPEEVNEFARYAKHIAESGGLGQVLKAGITSSSVGASAPGASSAQAKQEEKVLLQKSEECFLTKIARLLRTFDRC